MSEGFRLIADRAGLDELCQSLSAQKQIAVDTEFVPEHTYLPQLCLIQVAAKDQLAVIDPLAVGDLTPFWQTVLREGCELILHAGKEELRFCQLATGKLPAEVFDVQLAAGFVGLGFPQSHSTLVARLLQKRVKGTETRTDWRKRPLSDKQLDYALDDVRHLIPMRTMLAHQLERRGRLGWYREELIAMLWAIESPDEEWWRRIAGTNSFSRRELAILREVAIWRDQRAQQLDRPPRRVLRDDLVVELVKRRPTTEQDLLHVRGMGGFRDGPVTRDLIEAVRRGVELHDEECPAKLRQPEIVGEEQSLLKILSAAMFECAANSEVAPTLIGSNEYLRELLRWHSAGTHAKGTPKLCTGWRRDLCGEPLLSLLRGELTIRIDSTTRVPRVLFEPSENAEDGYMTEIM